MQGPTPTRYPKCAHIPRVKFINDVDDDVAESLGDSYDLPPLFESGMFERAFIAHYSMTSNERLRCRWREYVQSIESRQFSPFELPDVRELHFYDCAIRFLPSESIRHQEHRMKLKPGPGVDNRGQMPIPQEALMKRGTPVKAVKPDKRNMAGKGGKARKKPNSTL